MTETEHLKTRAPVLHRCSLSNGNFRLVFHRVSRSKTIFFIFLLFYRSAAYGFMFEVEGRIKHSVVLADGSHFSVKEVQYSASVSNRFWRLETQPVNVNVGEYWRRMSAGTDGTNIYTVVHDTAPPEYKGTVDAYGYRLSGQISRTTEPLLEEFTYLVWAVFASSYYMNEQHEAVVRAPWVSPREPNYDKNFACQVVRFEEQPRLPKTIVFLVRSIGGIKEFPVGEFHVTAVTNFLGSIVPVAFTLQRFAPAAQASDSEGRLLALYEGVVTRLDTPTGGTYVPRVEARVPVFDFRLRDDELRIDYTYYETPTDHWPAETDSVVMEVFEGMKELGRLARQGKMPTPPASHVFLRVAFYVFALAPIILLVWMAIRKRALKHGK